MSELPSLKRTDKEMSAEDVRAMLARAYSGRLATLSKSGWPYVVPLLYVWMNGELWMHNTRVRGHLRENVEHDARACFEIDEPGEIFPYGPIECDTNIQWPATERANARGT